MADKTEDEKHELLKQRLRAFDEERNSPEGRALSAQLDQEFREKLRRTSRAEARARGNGSSKRRICSSC